MKLKSINVKNFRLLKDITLTLEESSTVVVGRNNSGKTSLAELFRRLLIENSPKFSLVDFSLYVHEKFWDAFLLYKSNEEEQLIRESLPKIIISILCEYDTAAQDLGPLSEFIIDINPSINEANATVTYELGDGKIKAFFQGIDYTLKGDVDEQKKLFFNTIQARVKALYKSTLKAVDTQDPSNQKNLDMSKLRILLQGGFINAQRGLDDTTHKEKDDLGKVLERLFDTATSENATTEDKDTVKELEEAVQNIQETIDTDFNKNLNQLIPAFKLFGYPGFSDPNLHTETTLDVKQLLLNNTKVRYQGENGINLPETYNGLGSRNLIYILLRLLEFYKLYLASPIAPGRQLIFIEEPEAHLHPQMQEVFIRKLDEIATVFSSELGNGTPWPVQFIITTHSTHMANEVSFEAIRYFYNTKNKNEYTKIKDLRQGLTGTSFDDDKEFLYKYMTLTKCDLFFTDKAILIEGATERLLLPEIITKIDDILEQDVKKLSSQYLSVLEVGGAYAHKFFKLLDFLELKTLIITDLDSTESKGGKKCMVKEATHTSNACIKNWFDNTDISPSDLITKSETEKIKDICYLTYQIPEDSTTACGRSFEDAFLLANASKFSLSGTDDEKAYSAWDQAMKTDKTDFALKYAIEDTDWIVPKYIKDSLLWLAKEPSREHTIDASVSEEA